MAKALMKSNTAVCSGGDEESTSNLVGCLLEPIARDIINTQNYQIQTMKSLLDFVGAQESNDCKIGGATASFDLANAGAGDVACEDQTIPCNARESSGGSTDSGAYSQGSTTAVAWAVAIAMCLFYRD